jgi:5,10-methenyltetrahydrofolate synthetase
MGGPQVAEDWQKIAKWREEQRKRLVEKRLALSSIERAELDRRIIAQLDVILNSLERVTTLSIYWPFRGEPDLRGWAIERMARHGTSFALPVVTEKAAPLEFRHWTSDTNMERGVWGIPVPAGSPVVTPDVVIAPLVGFDRARYRLGYGGGYFDCTLQSMANRPVSIGVGYAWSELETIHPQPHDIPLDYIVAK